jgi:hypothetical protein
MRLADALAVVRALPREERAAVASIVQADLTAEALATNTAHSPTHYASDSLPPGVTSRAFLDACRRGELRASKVGRRWVASAADVHEWMRSKKPQTKPANDFVGPPTTREEALRRSGLVRPVAPRRGAR